MKAFPYDPQFNPQHNGMDLRDYFASQALPAIISTYKGEDTESASVTAYEYADAMMKAREL